MAAAGAGLGSRLGGALQQGQDLGLGVGSDQGDEGEVLSQTTLVQLRVGVAVVALLAGDLGQDAAVVAVGEEDARGGVQQAVEAVLPLGGALALVFVSLCAVNLLSGVSTYHVVHVGRAAQVCGVVQRPLDVAAV